MTDWAKWKLPPAQKASVLRVFNAARDAYARYLPDAADAERAACFWTAWHCTKALNLPQPLVRCAVALGFGLVRLMDRVAEFYDLERREPALCALAEADFQKLTGADLGPRRLRLVWSQ